jgi:hypothetical protein
MSGGVLSENSERRRRIRDFRPFRFIRVGAIVGRSGNESKSLIARSPSTEPHIRRGVRCLRVHERLVALGARRNRVEYFRGVSVIRISQIISLGLRCSF